MVPKRGPYIRKERFLLCNSNKKASVICSNAEVITSKVKTFLSVIRPQQVRKCSCSWLSLGLMRSHGKKKPSCITC